MKSAIGIGSLLMDGLGDTIRVSLTEDPEFEMEPCSQLAVRHRETKPSTRAFIVAVSTADLKASHMCRYRVQHCASFFLRKGFRLI